MIKLFWFSALLATGIQCPGTIPPGEAGTPAFQAELRGITDIPAPEPLLKITGLGNGYSSPAFTENHIYLTGEVDSLGYLSAYDWEGQVIWRKCYGPEWTKSYKGTRAAPVVDEQQIYVCTGLGDLICFDAQTGEPLWQVNMVEDLGGKNVTYGYSMPVLIDGEILFCAPGGAVHNVVALDKNSGRLLWSSPGTGETAGYGKPLLIAQGGMKILMTFSEFTFMGINAANGEVLWTFGLNFKGELPCNSPVYDEGIIYIAAGPGNGAVALRLSSDGRSIRELWRNMAFDTAFGGFVQWNDYLAGSSDSRRTFVLLDKRTGSIRSEIRFGRSATIRQGNILIAYNQRGQLGLFAIENGKLRLSQEFRITEGTGEHFGLPVLYMDRLLIRHGSTLLGFHL